jgi:hypothetical protein
VDLFTRATLKVLLDGQAFVYAETVVWPLRFMVSRSLTKCLRTGWTSGNSEQPI